MPNYRIASIAELARQMGFVPSSKRAQQIDAAEKLLHDLDPAKAYPLEYLIFRITGYHPKTSPNVTTDSGEELLTGLALQHDLGLLIEQVSDSLNQATGSISEPVLTIDDVAEKFNVTSKTIQRWRRKGLPARRFIFPDGKRRVGFLVPSIERFISLHSEEAHGATSSSALSAAETRYLLGHAKRLALAGQWDLNEIARRIGRKLNRSPLTLLHLLRQHPEITALLAPALSTEEQGRIARANRKGATVRELALSLDRPRSVIYRAVLSDRISRVLARKLKFIDDPIYHQPHAGRAIEEMVQAEELAAPSNGERVPKDLPAYFQSLYRTPLLTPGRERALFLKFNFHKFHFVAARRKLDAMQARWRDVVKLERHLRHATQTKNQITSANLRLVVSVAKKHMRAGADLMELVSEGNITLMRAIESFDPHKGNKFSTYATLALMKGYARAVPALVSAQRKAGQGEELLTTVADHRVGTPHDSSEDLRHLLSRLDTTERAVVMSHYELDRAHLGLAATPDDVRRTISTLSRHRLRQIEQRAMAKLRAAAEL